MAPKTLQLAHAELCDGCADLLPFGAVVRVDASCHVLCTRCARRHGHLVEHDPWAVIDNPELRERLRRRDALVHHVAA
jgi:hypothetical protein